MVSIGNIVMRCQHQGGGGDKPIIRPNFPENCVKMKKMGMEKGSANPKFYYVDPPLATVKPPKKGIQSMISIMS